MSYPPLVRMIVRQAPIANELKLLDLILQCAALARAGGPRYQRWAATCAALIVEYRRRYGQEKASPARPHAGYTVYPSAYEPNDY